MRWNARLVEDVRKRDPPSLLVRDPPADLVLLGLLPQIVDCLDLAVLVVKRGDPPQDDLCVLWIESLRLLKHLETASIVAVQQNVAKVHPRDCVLWVFLD